MQKFLFTLLSLGGLSMASSLAEVATGSSSANGVTFDVESSIRLTYATTPAVTGTSSVVTTPQEPSSGSAPGIYSVSRSPVTYSYQGVSQGRNASDGTRDVNATSVTQTILTTGLTSSASSTVNGLSGTKSTHASSGLSGLNLNFGTLSATIDPVVGATVNLNTSALSVTTGAISSFSNVTGSGSNLASLDASFSYSVSNFNISIFSVSILSFAPANLATDLEMGNPVNAIIDLEDVAISLPQGLSNVNMSGLIQISSTGIASDGILEGTASNSALRIGFQNINITAMVGGLIGAQTQVNGTVLAGENSAMQAVPEPSTCALIALGGGVVIWHLRRRRVA